VPNGQKHKGRFAPARITTSTGQNMTHCKGCVLLHWLTDGCHGFHSPPTVRVMPVIDLNGARDLFALAPCE